MPRMDTIPVTLKLGIVEADATFSAVLCEICKVLPETKAVATFDRPELAFRAIADGQINALLIDIFTIGIKKGIELIDCTRKRCKHVPICLLGSYEELIGFPGVPAEWAERFGHYFHLSKSQTIDAIRNDAAAIVNRLYAYLMTETAKARLDDARRFLLSHKAALAFLGEDAETRVVAALNIAEKAIEAKQTPAPVPEIVPGFADKDLQSLVQDTLDRAASALNRTARVNMGILIFGAGLLVSSFLAEIVTNRWELVAFGGFGVAGVVASLIVNPLKSIGLEARRLVQLQIAYLGFLNQIRLLNRVDLATDEKQTIERSKQLNDAAAATLKAIKDSFG